jgi:1-deoxy-D-xylulose-5-phosphate reductoisomerase
MDPAPIPRDSALRTPHSALVRVALLGSTGSIGRQTLEVIAAQPGRLAVVALAAGGNVALLNEQIRRFRPAVVAVQRERDRAAVEHERSRVHCGADGLLALATLPEADLVVVATSGHAAIRPTLAAIAAGKDLALANKETIVCAGELVAAAARERDILIRPIDSEHSALWQCLAGEQGAAVRRMILTASGGPFRTWETAQMADVGAAQALAHPTWRMGPKITVDCATLMNKGLEAIETHWLFGVPYDRIEVVVHPESIVHSLVEFVDGSLKAQLGWPDMKLPIQLALAGGERLPRPDPERRPFDLAALGRLHFEPPDPQRFPCLRLALEAGRAGGTAPAALCAADEVAVERFLRGEIRFGDIARVVEHTLERHPPVPVEGLGQLLDVDARARHTAALACASML